MFCLYTLPLARPAQAKIQMLTTSSRITDCHNRFKIFWTLPKDNGCSGSSGLTPLALPVAIFRRYSLSIKISSSNSVQVNNFQKVPFYRFVKEFELSTLQ